MQNDPILPFLLMVLLGYVVGSISPTYLLGRWVGGLDLRAYGSGNVGGSNVGVWVGRWATVVGGLLDVTKGALPTWLALRWALGLEGAVVAGLATVVGHDWSLFLRFRGGRGLATALGFLLVVAPWGWLPLLGGLALGYALHGTAIGALVGVVLLPVISLWTHRPQPVTLGCIALLFIVILKRLEANRLPFPRDYSRGSVLLNRLLLDRDIREYEAWIRRTPDLRA